jgi:hypothetical protein
VVFTPAVSTIHPEVCAAAANGSQTASYPEFLGAVSRQRPTIAVSGTHGKSTTTGLIASALSDAQQVGAVLCGAEVLGKGRHGWAGPGAWAIAEACEYRRHFLELEPEIGIVLSVEEDHFDIPIGFTVENFESGTIDPDFWTNDPYYPWILSTRLPQEGSFCLRSGVIDHDQSSVLTLTYTSNADGELSFYRKVSSETSYDFLVFKIDNVIKERWSGELPWFHRGFPVSAGTHTYAWSYEKDYSVSNGDDCAYIDYITLPPFLDKTDETPENPLTIHPNPTTDLVWINIEQEGDYVVNVYDGKGKLILSKRNDNKLSFSKMTAGIYHIEVVQNGQRWSRKMIKM